MSADRIMALADSGTPGPWAAEAGGSEAHYIYGARGHSLARPGHPEARDRVGAINWLDWQSDKENAAKIVAAVNALPKVAALAAAIDALPKFDPPPPQYHDPACDGTGCGCWLVTLVDTLLTARDELVAALGVDQ